MAGPTPPVVCRSRRTVGRGHLFYQRRAVLTGVWSGSQGMPHGPSDKPVGVQEIRIWCLRPQQRIPLPNAEAGSGAGVRSPLRRTCCHARPEQAQHKQKGHFTTITMHGSRSPGRRPESDFPHQDPPSAPPEFRRQGIVPIRPPCERRRPAPSSQGPRFHSPGSQRK